MFIKHTDYQSFCDYSYENELPPSGIVYVPMDKIYEFFVKVFDSQTRNEYIVVSASSDYGFCYQKQNPVWLDMKKWLSFVNIGEQQSYNDLLIPARCNKEYCKSTDLYSIKMYSFTQSTINGIPNQIKKWYCTNNSSLDSRVVQIPFGVPEWSFNLLQKTQQKEDKVYVNFQPNTVERSNLYSLSGDHFVKKSDVSHEEYVEDIKRYKYVLCPPGNGIDSFRISEVLACGSIPIVFNIPEMDVYGNSVIRTYDFNNIYYHARTMQEKVVENTAIITKEYWRQEIESNRN